MTKINFDKYRKTNRYLGSMNNEYWTNPIEGFDSAWHNRQEKPKTYNYANKNNTKHSLYRQPRVSEHTSNEVAKARELIKKQSTHKVSRPDSNTAVEKDIGIYHT